MMQHFKKNVDKTIVFSFFLIILTSKIVSNILLYAPSMDVNWNYSYAKFVSLGMMPYQDFNIITTPFSFYFNAFFLKMFGDQFIVICFLGAICTTITLYLFYKIIKFIKNDTNQALIFTLIIAMLISYLPRLYTYNEISMLIIIGIIYLEILNINKKIPYFNVIISLCLGLLLMTKHSWGFFILGAHILNLFVQKNSLKEFVNDLIKRIILLLFIVIGFVFYLYYNNALYDFIDYAILGLRDFANDNGVGLDFLFKTSTYIILLILILILKIIRRNLILKNNIITIITIYSLFSLLIVYPLFDGSHVILAISPSLLLLPYLIKFEDRKIGKAILIILIIASSLFLALYYYKEEKYVFYNESKHYKYILIPEWLKLDLEEIKNYINQKTKEGKKAIIIDNRAIHTNAEMDVFMKDFNLLMKGNLGYDGELRIIKKIKNMDKDIFLLIGNYERTKGDQMPLSISNYIKENYKYIESVSFYDVYQK